MRKARTPRSTPVFAALSAIVLGCGGAPAAPESAVATPPAPAASAAPAPAAGPPAAEKKPVVDEYHGVKVTDDYRWLEKGGDPAVAAWSAAQTQYARGVLGKLPASDELRKTLTALKTAQSADHFGLMRRGNVLFALKWDPSKQQPTLVTLKSEDDAASAHVLVDPNELDRTGTTTIDFYVPSLDGKRVAVSLSKGGTEDGTVHVYDVATGKELADVIPRVNGGTAGGSLSWNNDGSGFFYTRYPRGTERPAEDLPFFQQIYFHKLGQPTADDVYSLGKDFPRIAEVELATRRDGKYVLAQVANGDGGEFAFYLRDSAGKWTEVARLGDKVVEAHFGDDDGLYLLSRAGAPRGKVLRVPVAKPDLAKATTVVPESKASIRAVVPAKTRLYVVDLLGGPSQVRVFDLKGKEQGMVPLPAVPSVGQVARLDGDDVLVRAQTFIEPPAWYRYSPKTGKAVKTGLFATSPASFADAEVVRETCKSKDGTEVPLNIIRKKGAPLDHARPTFLNGYGGYGISLSPRFNEEVRVWLDRGGVWAVANLRGGGELGEDWHLAGNLTRKQNVFDDFAACAKHLDEAGYTSPAKIGLVGGSNGGLLMGAMLTQHPELFRAVVSHVGIYDMLRVEAWPNGAFNVTEYGTVKDPEQFKALFAYSPYHHVTDGAKYPAALFITGENDPRVDPSQSRKMVARLRAASPGGTALLVSKADAGHGVGGSLQQEIDDAVDQFSFLFHELGMDGVPPAK